MGGGVTMFTTPCFIRKNSSELRDKVYRLGGRSGEHLWDSSYNTLLVADKDTFRCYDDEWKNADNLVKKGYIDCGVNEDLFLAIASVRDDSDINQYFINEVRLGSINHPESVIEKGSLIKCLVDKWNYPNNDFDSSGLPYHKATVDELKEHFKQ